MALHFALRITLLGLLLMGLSGDAFRLELAPSGAARVGFTLDVTTRPGGLGEITLRSLPGLSGQPVRVAIYGPGALTAETGARGPGFWNLAGVQIPWLPAEEQELETLLAAASGAQMIGMDFDWKKIQPKAGQYDWSATDAAVRLAKKYGLRIAPMLVFTPEWASSAPFAPLDFYRAPPVRSSLYRDFVYQVVQRYKPGGILPETQDGYGITDWVIWNEPNVQPAGQDPFPLNFWYGSLESYIELLRAGYDGAHAADPRANVLNAGLADVYWKPGQVDLLTSLERFYDPNGDGNAADGGRPFFDTLNLHIYPGSAPDKRWYQDRLDAVLRLMERFGDSDKKIWVTETGYGSSRAMSPGQPPPEGELPLLAQEDQAEAVRMIFEVLAEYPQVERVFWWSLRDYFVNDSRVNQSMEGHYGLVRANFYPKPAYFAYLKQASGMDLLDWQVVSLAASGRMDVSIPVEVGRQPGAYLVLAWLDSPEQDATFSIPAYRAAAAFVRVNLAQK